MNYRDRYLLYCRPESLLGVTKGTARRYVRKLKNLNKHSEYGIRSKQEAKAELFKQSTKRKWMFIYKKETIAYCAKLKALFDKPN